MCMRQLVFFLVTMTSLCGTITAQSCDHPQYQRSIRVLSEYRDVSTFCEQSKMEDGSVVDFVVISLDGYPDLWSVQIAFEDIVMWTMHIPHKTIDVDMALALVDAVEDTYWTGDIGDQGELKLIRFFYAESDEEMEEELISGISEFIDLNDLCGAASSQTEEAPLQLEGEDWYVEAVQGCVKSIQNQPSANLLPPGTNLLGYCQCLADQMASDDKVMVGLFNPDEDVMKELIGLCMQDFLPGFEEEMMDEFDFDEFEFESKFKDSFMRKCIPSAKQNMMSEGKEDNGNSLAYCNCAFENFKGKESIDMSDIGDVNGELSADLDADCGHLLWADSPDVGRAFWNNTISMCHDVGSIPFINGSAGAVKVKVSFGGVLKYMTVDSGCSEVLIDGDLAKELKRQGIIAPGSYEGIERFILADGSEVWIEKFKVSTVQIGDCEMKDFVVGVIDEGGMLLGMGFWGLFDSWSIDQVRAQIRVSAKE